MAVAADAGGNAIVTGYVFGTNVTIKFSAAGMPMWTNRYGTNYGRSIATDPNGNVFVTGQSYTGTNDGFVVVNYAAPPAPGLNIQRLGNSVVLNWTNSGFGLLSAPTVSGTITNDPGTTSPHKNAVSSGPRFSRLAQ